jgi:alpha-D-ribose 1-methylphosphonate 5-triphosphate synthase subunit PhnI
MYTTVRGMETAAAAAAHLVAVEQRLPAHTGPDTLDALLPLLIDQVIAEAGIADREIASRALLQAHGDLARALSLLRAWAATLSPIGTSRCGISELAVTRRITPAFASPPGGQHLGASLDYAPRLLQLDDRPPRAPSPSGTAPVAATTNGLTPRRGGLRAPPRALAELEHQGVVATPDPVAIAVDATREVADPTSSRGAFQQLLSRAETGALTATSYTAQRGYAQRQDPTLTELRRGTLPITVTHPLCGAPVEIGHLEITTAEIVLYRVHDGDSDAQFTLGFGATLGRVERRAIAAAMLDAGCARAAHEPPGQRAPADDQEFLALVLDGQEATGFVEHLKLPHHVTFTSDLDRVRVARRGGDEITPGEITPDEITQ